LAPL
jgi:hypothetical protein